MYPLISISGKMCSGKSTLADILVSKYSYTEVSISSLIMKVLGLILKGDKEKLSYLLSQSDNLSVVDEIFTQFEKTYNILETTFDENQNREMLQYLGKKVREICKDDSIWLKILISTYLPQINAKEKIVISGLRMIEEKEFLSSYNFKHIRLDITPEEQEERLLKLYGNICQERKNHISEISLDTETFDLRILNNISLSSLENTVVSFLNSNSTSVLAKVVSLAKSIPNNERDNWVQYFMSLAYMVSMRSTCGSRRVGALLIDSLEPGKRRLIASGYNGYPKGEKHCVDGGCPRYLAKLKGELQSGDSFNDALYPCHAYHAEHNVLNQILTTSSVSTGAILFCTTHPCITCARMINGANIKTIYYAEGYPDELSKAYLELQDITVIKVETL